MQLSTKIQERLAALLLFGILIAATGCRQAPPVVRSDQQITTDIQSRLGAESALSGQNIQVIVNGGVATLNGIANDEASRALAGHDAGSVNGVKTVVNNLMVAPKLAAAPPPLENPLPELPALQPRRKERSRAGRPSLPPQPPLPAAPGPVTPPPIPVDVPSIPVAPPTAKPAFRTVTLREGTIIPVRMIDTLDSATAQPGQSFRGSLAADLISDGMIAVPQGTAVVGRVVDAKNAGHFEGSALLSIELTAINVHGHTIPVVTDTYSRQGDARGKDTLAKTGGGAVLGAAIGALAGRGKGAAIGALAGGGAGVGINAVTRGQQVRIPSETLVNFHLQSPISVRTSRALGDSPQNVDDRPQLQQRPVPPQMSPPPMPPQMPPPPMMMPPMQ